ncbi:ABC transporter substrate-binding protein [Treponema primitia]|uniref:ABC transporter substrate-binding protein n=1 Tax=Treponema primitia TaxID=88058 RepID=UPI0002554F68|nr:ABC transporter substrate-binding protein [Treponema primitia]
MTKPLVLCILATLLLSGCSQKTARLLTDRGGNTVSVSGQINKIISTAPSSTEIIVDLGLADKLVAIDKYSLDIEGVKQDLPLIDFFFPDAEAIIGINPDIIISNGHNNLGAGDDPFKLIREAGIPVVYIPLSSGIDGICRDIEFVADMLNVSERGRELSLSMKTQIAEIAAVGRTIENKKTVYFEISPPPELVTIGQNTYLHEMITVIGCVNIFADQIGVIFPSAEAILERNPDVIITGLPERYTPSEEIKNREGFEHITAVRNNAIYRVDTNSASRPSARILFALKQMAKAVYPDKYEKF